MALYVMASRINRRALDEPSSFEAREREVVERIESQCDVTWIKNLTLMGPWDHLDLFEAPDNETAMKVATIMRTNGQAVVEVWPAMEWQDFKGLVRDLK